MRLGHEVYFSYFKYLKALVAVELPNGLFGIFIAFWVLTSFCNLSSVSEVEFLDREINFLSVDILTQKMHK